MPERTAFLNASLLFACLSSVRPAGNARRHQRTGKACYSRLPARPCPLSDASSPPPLSLSIARACLRFARTAWVWTLLRTVRLTSRATRNRRCDNRPFLCFGGATTVVNINCVFLSIIEQCENGVPGISCLCDVYLSTQKCVGCFAVVFLEFFVFVF